MHLPIMILAQLEDMCGFGDLFVSSDIMNLSRGRVDSTSDGSVGSQAEVLPDLVKQAAKR